MPVNWGLANEGQFDYLSSLQGLGNAALQQQNLKQQQYNFGNVQKQDAARPGLFARAQGGDYAGAGNAALANNDLDAFKVIGGLREDQRQQVKMHSQLIGGFAASLSQLPDGPARVAAFRAAAPQLLKQGFTQDELAQADLSDNGLRGYIAAAGATDSALEAYYKSQQPVTLADGSIQLGPTPMGGGQRQVVGENPKDADYIWDSARGGFVVKPGTGGVGTGAVIQPGTQGGGGQPSAGSSAPMTVAGLKPLFSAQESSGSYEAVNKDTGALGRYQVMPGTGAAIAKRLGIEWRPDMMRHDGPQDRAYQDKIGDAVIAEAIAKSGGDPTAAFGYYYSGTTDRSKWGPKTKQYIADMTTRLGGGNPRKPGGAPAQPSNPSGFIPVVAPKEKDAPSGYRYNGDTLEPIPGGPADPSTPTSRNVTSVRKTEGDNRKEFENEQTVKNFRVLRPQYYSMRDNVYKQNQAVAAGKKPNPASDISLIFNFMKILDPTSVVREGEYATAMNTAGVPDQIRNQYNKARTGSFLNPQQRLEYLKTAEGTYRQSFDAYNSRAEQYRGYARDYGVNPDNVARTYTSWKDDPTKPRSGSVKVLKIERVK